MPRAVQTACVAPPSTKFVSDHRQSWMVLKAERSLSQVTRLRGAQAQHMQQLTRHTQVLIPKDSVLAGTS